MDDCISRCISECSNIELDDAVNYQCNGVYSNDGQEPCNDKPSYKHITTSSFYMYHTSGYWVVHNVWCSPGADDQGYLRVLSSANSPEWISYAEKWEENRGGWITNLEINTECTYGKVQCDMEYHWENILHINRLEHIIDSSFGERFSQEKPSP